MKEYNLSKIYKVRRLTKSDINIILEVCSKNNIFYQYHPPMATRESIIEDMNALPPQKELKDKFYVGFFEEEKLIAIMDLILDFPKEKTAYIGFFMMRVEYQGKGIGTEIIMQALEYLKEVGYQKAELAIDKGNPQSERFWTKLQFKKSNRVCLDGDAGYIPMEKVL